MVFREKGGGQSQPTENKGKITKKIDCQFIAYQGRGHKNDTQPDRGSGEFYCDTAKILRYPPPSPPPPLTPGDKK